MASLQSFLYSSGRYCLNKYSKIQTKYLTFLPKDPLETSNDKQSIVKNFLSKIKIYVKTKDYDPLIQNELHFFLNHQSELNPLQSVREIGNLLQILKKTENLEGDILELGVAGGGTTIMMAHLLKKINSSKKIFGCDTFIGLPYEDRYSDKASESIVNNYSHSLNEVSQKIIKFGLQDKIELIKGLFEETLYQKLSEKKFSFVLLDCDLYDATKFCLDFLYPRLVKNGLIVLDDYGGGAGGVPKGRWGATKAVDEFCESQKISLITKPEPMIKK